MGMAQRFLKCALTSALILLATTAQGSLLGEYAGSGDFLSNTSWGDQKKTAVKLELRFLDNGLLLYRDCWALQPLPLCIGSQLKVVGNELWHQNQKIGFFTDQLVATEYRQGNTWIVSRLEKTPYGFSFSTTYQEGATLIQKTAILQKRNTMDLKTK